MGKQPVESFQTTNVNVDGESGSSKGTSSNGLARCLRRPKLLDSGALYRIVGQLAVLAGIALVPENESKIGDIAWNLPPIGFEGRKIILNGIDRTDELRTTIVGGYAKEVAKLKEVHDALKPVQIGLRSGCEVFITDGRDMWQVFDTVPGINFYFTATPEARAAWAVAALVAKGLPADYHKELAAIIERDRDDKTRAVAPLIQCPTAKVIDTTEMTREEIVEVMLQHCRTSPFWRSEFELARAA